MAKLSKAQIAAHQRAEELLALDVLDDDQRTFMLDNWQESARHVNSAAGAFFTPSELAPSVVCYANGAETIIDLCAGIGCLGLWAWWLSGRKARVTCVEINPDYVAVGKKVFPEAEWICASVTEARGQFDCALSNPPFGKTAKIEAPRYSGEDDLAVVDIASDLASWGVFILPSMSVPFEYSGRTCYRERQSAKYDRFTAATGIQLLCESTDTTFAKPLWRGVAPNVEVASCDFEEARAHRQHAGLPLFAEAAA
ncbi:MAG: methyltransferase [Sphingomonas sp.]|uniref:methyltransferase n=1 Tax=Sphingomonas sp. TaxID=28214 RepID=UPI001B1CD554|nr:methyltransferase [Sphingomonas sp.]MBO9624141.1 methyltransferase [Sphingomonas sp.]